MSYEEKQKAIEKEMKDLSNNLSNLTKSNEYSKGYSKGYSECQKEYEEKVNVLLSALEQIANAPRPFNAFENEVFVSVSTDIAQKAVSFYNAT